jgi:DNA-3-methyladenine glycosylase I
MSELITKYQDGLTRCYWPKQDEDYLKYHDTEWGVPLRGDDELFERLALEGFQAGLSWLTILKRREGFRRAFAGFKITKVAEFGEAEIERLLMDDSIIRNRAKIRATINNAQVALSLEGGLTNLIWEHAPKKKTPAAKDFNWLVSSEESELLSKTLKAKGFSFVGPTTMYAMMQAIGMINDHAPGCFRRVELK